MEPRQTTAKPIRKGRLAKKILLLRIGTGLILGLAISATGFYLARQSLVRQIHANMASYILLLEAEAKIFLHRTHMNLSTAAGDPALEKYFNTSRMAVLNEFLSRHAKNFAALSYLDADGREVARYVRLMPSGDLQSRNTDTAYRLALSLPNRAVTSGARMDKAVGETVFDIYFHRRDFFDRDIGTLMASVPASELRAALQGAMETIDAVQSDQDQSSTRPSSHRNTVFMIVDRQGAILAHSDPSFTGRPVSTVAAVFSNPKPVFGDSEPIKIGKQRFFVDSIPMGMTGWRLYVITNEYKAMRPVHRLGFRIFILTLAFLLATELFSRRLGLNLTEPINRLLAKTREITEAGIGGGRVEWRSRDELGELAESFNTMLDRLEEAHDALNREKQFIEDIFDAMEEGLVVTDIHGTISEHNRAARELLGADDLNGKSLGDFFPATVPVHTWWPQVAAGQRMSNIETVITSTKGEEIDVAVSLAPLFQDASSRGLVCGISDIRERKRLEAEKARATARIEEVRDELMAAEKLAVVGQMSGLVAHEVLNPISAINIRVSMALTAMEDLGRVIGVLGQVVSRFSGKAESGELASHLESDQGKKDLLLLEKIAAALREKLAERSEDFRFLDRQVSRVIKIIDNLREMSRHQKTVEEFSLARLINEVIDDQRDGLAKRGIEVKREFAAEPTLTADYMEIYSIFSNLLRNAVHAIDEKGAGDGQITITIDMEDGAAVTRVSDNGCGMGPEVTENLFTPGFTSKGRKGTGLGLSYSRKIARAMHGDIVLEKSIPGEGSTFTVVIPLAAEGKKENGNGEK